MNNQTDGQPAVIPFGEGGAELGMTRGEIQEHIDWLWSYNQVQTEFVIEMVFAWFVAMTFIAKRLTTRQFIVAHVFYLLFLVRQYMAMEDATIALGTWIERNGLSPVNTDPGLVTYLYNNYLGIFMDQFLFLAVVAGSVWWSVSCRKTGKTLFEPAGPD
ncbi:MAG: hypothetical protein AAGA23_12565 [Pseudomonadota bacterium]